MPHPHFKSNTATQLWIVCGIVSKGVENAASPCSRSTARIAVLTLCIWYQKVILDCICERLVWTSLALAVGIVWRERPFFHEISFGWDRNSDHTDKITLKTPVEHHHSFHWSEHFCLKLMTVVIVEDVMKI